jgi:uncharacterized damage-inducible protein DinB
VNDPKATLKRYLQAEREALLWKLEGLSERELRWPRTPTGTNLLGLVKHVAFCELWYFGETFGRPYDARMPDVDTDPNADLFATADETRDDIVGLYRQAWLHADATIDVLDLDSIGSVPWWPEDRREVTLHRVLVHVIADTARHAGHADILREGIDGAAGLFSDKTNLPDVDWPAHVARLQEIADAT